MREGNLPRVTTDVTPYPLVRDMLDDHLLSSTKGIISSDPLFIHVQGVHSMDALFILRPPCAQGRINGGV